MSIFPEAPILLYPSLAIRVGLEEAVLLGIYHQCAAAWGARQQGEHYFLLTQQQWLQLVPFWDEDTLARITHSLVQQGYIEARWEQRSVLRLRIFEQQISKKEFVEEEPVSPVRPMQSLANELRQQSSLSTPSPTPTPILPNFGGSVGWPKRTEQPVDALEAIFAQKAAQNQQYQTLSLDWRPSETVLSMLEQHHRIGADFSLACLDEFLVFWAEQEKRKAPAGWDQAFMKWVKREWIRQQSKGNNQTAGQGSSEQVVNGQGRKRTREDREQVRQNLLDINNLDW